MWFKQVRIFQLSGQVPNDAEKLSEQLEILAFQPCLPSLPESRGFVSPFDKDGAPLTHPLNGYIMFAMQIEEKVLPAQVIAQVVDERVRELEAQEDRPVRSKEKRQFKEEATNRLMPQAFSKLTKIYAYIDTKNNWLIVNTTNAGKIEAFITLFKRAVPNIEVRSLELVKISPVLTKWVLDAEYPEHFSIEKNCMMQDPQQVSRTISCKHQDLFAESIQSLLSDGCQVKKIALNWRDKLQFMFTDEFTLQSIKYDEELIEQSKQDSDDNPELRFDADMLIMTATLNDLLQQLCEVFQE